MNATSLIRSLSHLLTLSKLRPDRAEQEHRVKAWNKLTSSPETGKSPIREVTGPSERAAQSGTNQSLVDLREVRPRQTT